MTGISKELLKFIAPLGIFVTNSNRSNDNDANNDNIIFVINVLLWYFWVFFTVADSWVRLAKLQTEKV